VHSHDIFYKLVFSRLETRQAMLCDALDEWWLRVFTISRCYQCCRCSVRWGFHRWSAPSYIYTLARDAISQPRCGSAVHHPVNPTTYLLNNKQ
jgi:hypothetical protein